MSFLITLVSPRKNKGQDACIVVSFRLPNKLTLYAPFAVFTILQLCFLLFLFELFNSFPKAFLALHQSNKGQSNGE